MVKTSMRGKLIVVAFAMMVLFTTSVSSQTPYIITNKWDGANLPSGEYAVVKDGNIVGVVSVDIETAIEFIKTDANGENCIIQFGNGDDLLDLGYTTPGERKKNRIYFENKSESKDWGIITLTGKLNSGDVGIYDISNVPPYGSGVINVDDGVSGNSWADITNAYNSSQMNFKGVILNNSYGTVTINGGMLDLDCPHVNHTFAIYFRNGGTLVLKGSTVVTNDVHADSVVLGGAPKISGTISSNNSINLIMDGSGIFAPGDNVYGIRIGGDVEIGTVIVADGKDFLSNFIGIFNTGATLTLAVKDNDIIIVENTTSVQTPDRLTPQIDPNKDVIVVAPPDSLLNTITAGPNPVAGQSGAVRFYRTGKRIKSGTLTIYDALGNPIKTIRVNDKSSDDNSSRLICEWDLAGKRGRSVAVGTYAVKGTIKTYDGKKENVSLVVGVY